MRIYLKEHGFLPNQNCDSVKLYNFLQSLDKDEEKEIIFEKGVYKFSEEQSVKEIMFITNTASEKEMYPPYRKIGILLRNLNNITLIGNDTILLYNGRMTEFVIENCKNVKITGFRVDFEFPSVAEFDVIDKSMLWVKIKPNRDSVYTIENGKFRFNCDKKGRSVTQMYDEEKGYTSRVISLSYTLKPVFFNIRAVEVEPGIIKLFLPFSKLKVGKKYQYTTILRDGAGTFMNKSENITLENNVYNFIHGMGLIAQLCNNIDITNCKIVPNKERGRTTATFADMIHCCMCSGKVNVTNCEFEGSRDDIINIHGNHFKLVNIDQNKISLKFMHPQAYGFLAFKSGDEIEFIDNITLAPIETAIVSEAKMINERITEVVLTKTPSDKVRCGNVVENATMTCELHFENNKAKHIPTRGVLVTTRKKVVIKNNYFDRTFMSAILVSDDANTWYESGYVTDVTIEGNTFDRCIEPVINILPEAHSKNNIKMVHKNIKVLNNKFILAHPTMLQVKRTKNFIFKGNSIEGVAPKNIIENCEDCVIE